MSSIDRLRDELSGFSAELDRSSSLETGKRSSLIDRIAKSVEKAQVSLSRDFAQKALSKTDVQALQLLQVELENVAKRVGRAVAGKLLSDIRQLMHTGVDKAYFAPTSTLWERLEILFHRFGQFFVTHMNRAVHREIFYTWDRKVMFHENLGKIVDLTEEIKSLKAQGALSPQQEARLSFCQKKLEQLERVVREYEHNLASAAATRNNMKTAGAIQLAIHTRDGETLDSMYWSANQFRAKCQSVGAGPACLQVNGRSVRGLVFPKAAAKDFLAALSAMKVFLSEDGKGSGWALLHVKDKVMIIPDGEFEELTKVGYITGLAPESVLSEEATLTEESFTESRGGGGGQLF